MKNFFKASLLAVLFVGMSSFSNVESVNFEDDNQNCDDYAAGGYWGVLITGGSQSAATAAYSALYWACIDNGGDSEQTLDLDAQ